MAALLYVCIAIYSHLRDYSGHLNDADLILLFLVLNHSLFEELRPSVIASGYKLRHQSY